MLKLLIKLADNDLWHSLCKSQRVRGAEVDEEH